MAAGAGPGKFGSALEVFICTIFFLIFFKNLFYKVDQISNEKFLRFRFSIWLI